MKIDEQLLNTLGQPKSILKVVKPWGFEFIFDCGPLLLKFIHVAESHQTSLQYHRVKEEVIKIIAGSGHIEIRREVDSHLTLAFVTNKTFYDTRIRLGDPPCEILPGQPHRAVGPLLMLEFTTPQNDDVVRLEDDYGRKS